MDRQVFKNITSATTAVRSAAAGRGPPPSRHGLAVDNTGAARSLLQGTPEPRATTIAICTELCVFTSID